MSRHPLQNGSYLIASELSPEVLRARRLRNELSTPALSQQNCYALRMGVQPPSHATAFRTDDAEPRFEASSRPNPRA